ncbi:MAG: response regulator [Gemmataceae bacterium]
MSDQPLALSRNGGASTKVKILLVDDQPANLLALEAVLDELGQELVRAGSGEEALRLLQVEAFAVILLDVHMEGLDGFETGRRIRANPRSQHTPIIFQTGHEADERLVTAAYQLGAVDFLVKPLVPVILRAKVAAFVDLFQDKEKARRQADQFRQLVEGTVDYAIFLLDPEGRVSSWNLGAQRIKGYMADEIIGQHFSRFYPREAVDRRWPEYELERAAIDGRFEDEDWRVRKDGSTFWANVVITTLRDDTGVVRGFSKVTRDLTERKRAEDELRRARDELEVRVAHRTQELTDANARLAESSRRKDQFLAMLAHELRNPLAPVLHGLQVLELSEADQVAVEKVRIMMERQIRHLSRLVDDLMDVTRITQGRVPVRRERLDLAGLVRVAAEDRRHLLRSVGMALDVEVDDVPVWVLGDAIRLTQVLNNLFDNAVKFRNGGDRISVRLAVDALRRQVVIEVSDKGMGIAPELFPKLFEVFTQGDESLDRSRGGLGVGLSVVKGLIELHGGTVRAESEGLGRGARFTVTLPLNDEVPAVGVVLPESPKLPSNQLRILVVEDNRDAADSLRMVLELLGHEVRVAYNGRDGVTAARDWRPDVVLCDIGLPGLDGYGVADELRHDPMTAAVRLIAVTGYGQDEDRRRSREAGFDYHLVKPVDARDLRMSLVRSA